MNIKFSRRLCTNILELNISMKKKFLGWRLISKKGYNFIQKDVWFEGDRIPYGLRMNFHFPIGFIHIIYYIDLNEKYNKARKGKKEINTPFT